MTTPKVRVGSLRQMAVAGLVSAATVVGGVVSPAVANAIWDVEAYDACMEKTIRNADHCCLDSGGWLSAKQGCVAPPADSEEGKLAVAPWSPAPIAPPRGAVPPVAVQPPIGRAG